MKLRNFVPTQLLWNIIGWPLQWGLCEEHSLISLAVRIRKYLISITNMKITTVEVYKILCTVLLLVTDIIKYFLVTLTPQEQRKIRCPKRDSNSFPQFGYKKYFRDKLRVEACLVWSSCVGQPYTPVPFAFCSLNNRIVFTKYFINLFAWINKLICSNISKFHNFFYNW